MAGAKEIRTKIASIKNTQKITKAMEMVAASKMRKAQDRMFATRPYAAKIKNVIGHLAHAHPEYHHPYLVERPAKRIGLVVISTDRGLCGGLNINLFKAAIAAMKEWKGQNLEIDLAVIGRAVEKHGDDENNEDDQYDGADNAFFQCTFHHDLGGEYSQSACSAGPTT